MVMRIIQGIYKRDDFISGVLSSDELKLLELVLKRFIPSKKFIADIKGKIGLINATPLLSLKPKSPSSKKARENKLIVQAITKRDSELFATISSIELLKYSRDPGSCENINKFMRYTNNTSEWFTLQVASQENEKSQIKMVKRIAQIGLSFQSLGNLNGVMIIGAALAKSQFAPFVKNLDEASKRMLNISDPLGNYKNYYNELKKCEKASLNGASLLPAMGIILRELEFMNGESTQVNDTILRCGKYFRKISLLWSRCAFEFNDNCCDFINFFTKMPDIDPHLAQAFSHCLSKEQELLTWKGEKRNFLKIAELATIDLIYFFAGSEDQEEINLAKALCKINLCGGADLIEQVSSCDSTVATRQDKLVVLGLSHQQAKLFDDTLTLSFPTWFK